MNSSSTDKVLAEISGRVKKSRNKLLLLDFDGTLVEFTSDISEAVPSKSLQKLLKNIAGVKGSQLIIVTGRRQDDIDTLVGHLPVDIIAEHGAMIRETHIWKLLLDGSTDWKNKVYQIAKGFVEVSPNSFIEEKPFSLAWHYRNVEQKTGKASSRALIRALSEIALQHNLRIIDGHKVVEIVNGNINKGSAIQYLLNKRNYDYILSIGDDKTDEDMFRVLLNNDNAFTVKIGRGNTCAKYKLHKVQQVILLLEQLLAEMRH